MDEFQLVETYREGFATLWAQLQWWASVSFGLLALASFGREHLSLAATIGLSVLYAVFSVFSLINVYAMMGPITGAVSELGSLDGLSEVGQIIVDSLEIRKMNGLITLICVLATFCGTLAYLWHAYRKNEATAG